MRAFREKKKQRQEEKARVIAHIVKESIEKLKAEEDKRRIKMREILFRGKRKDNGKWIEGYYAPFASNKGLKRAIYTGIDKGCIIPIEVIPETVGQYTGLKDKNGNKIFEGDLIDDDVWSVAYCDGKGEFRGMQAGWYVQRDAWESWYGLTYDTLAEVIGNIYDNPELLKGERQ